MAAQKMISKTQRLDSLFHEIEKGSDSVDHTLNVNHLRVLAVVKQAGDNGIEIGDIRKKLGYPSSSMSRLASQLSKFVKGNEIRGAQFIEFRVDEIDRRVHRAYLTEKGADFMKSLEELI